MMLKIFLHPGLNHIYLEVSPTLSMELTFVNSLGPQPKKDMQLFHNGVR